MDEQEIHQIIRKKLTSFVRECVSESGKIKTSQTTHQITQITTCAIYPHHIIFPSITDMLSEEKFTVALNPEGGHFRARIKTANSGNSQSQNFDFWLKNIAFQYNKQETDFEILDNQKADFDQLVFFSLAR